MIPSWTQIYRGLVDVVFPRDCIVCGWPACSSDIWHYLCGDCAVAWPWINGPTCLRCGVPFYGDVTSEQMCADCSNQPHLFCRGHSLLKLEGIAREFIHVLKYQRGTYLLPDIRNVVARQDHTHDFLRESILVPVPLHFWRQQQRGFNQSRLIAQGISQVIGTAKINDLLKRSKNTSTQTQLPREDRRNNMKNAFAFRGKALLDKSVRYILVDDVYTTGATLNACATVLKSAGAVHVDIFTLCHG